jgi:ribosomal protein S27E
MSYPSIEIVCGKCGSVINKIISLKSIKDVLRPTNGRCKICGNALNPSEFTIELEKQ